MKIVVDTMRCTGIGICESIAPEVFEVGDDGSVNVFDERVDDADGTVVEAVRCCPAHSLSISTEQP
jgi:ferredoxin